MKTTSMNANGREDIMTNEISFEDTGRVTVAAAEYRSLVKTACEQEIALGLLIDAMYLDYSDKPAIYTKDVLRIIQQFAPRAYEQKLHELKEED